MKKPPPPYSFLATSGNACITACVALVVVAGIRVCSFLLLTTTGIRAEPLAEDTAAHHRALIAELQRMASHLERANHRLDDTAAAGVRFDSLEMRLAEVHAMLGVLAEAVAGSGGAVEGVTDHSVREDRRTNTACPGRATPPVHKRLLTGPKQ